MCCWLLFAKIAFVLWVEETAGLRYTGSQCQSQNQQTRVVVPLWAEEGLNERVRAAEFLV